MKNHESTINDQLEIILDDEMLTENDVFSFDRIECDDKTYEAEEISYNKKLENFLAEIEEDSAGFLLRALNCIASKEKGFSKGEIKKAIASIEAKKKARKTAIENNDSEKINEEHVMSFYEIAIIIKLEFKKLEYANLKNTYLAYIDLTDTKLNHANLDGADLRGSIMEEVNLTNASLHNADLTDTDLTDANLTNADLSSTYLDQSKLNSACLKKANLTDASLEYAELVDTDLTDTILGNTDFDDADITNAIFNNAEELSRSRNLEKTIGEISEKSTDNCKKLVEFARDEFIEKQRFLGLSSERNSGLMRL